MSFIPFRWNIIHEYNELVHCRDPGALAYAIKRSCENKAEVVSLDEKEGGIRATLNLGHTFGHVSYGFVQLIIFVLACITTNFVLRHSCIIELIFIIDGLQEYL
jgi:hypothetical protein